MTALQKILSNPHQKDGQLWAAFLFLIVATTLVYAVSFFNGFVLDDEMIIVNNPQTLSLHNITEVLFSPDVIKPYYRPLNRATYLFDYHMVGMNPIWYHGVNVVIHVGNVLLLYVICCRFFRDRSAALLAALLFAVHPANSEAVNFISARNTLLALFFSLASLLTFISTREQGKRLPLFSALLFLCGLLSKETALLLIVIIFIYSIVPLPGQKGQKQGKGSFILLMPYLLALALYFLMRVYSLHDLLGTSVPTAGLLKRLSQNLTIIPQYLVLLLVPFDLTIYHTANPGTGFFSHPGVVVGIWVVALGAIWALFRAGNSATSFGMAWCVINYAPISNIVPIPAEPIAERFLYLPAVGFFIVVGSLLTGINTRKHWKSFYWPVMSMIIIFLAFLTVQRSRDWKDNITLCTSGVRNNPASAPAHYNLGTALRDQGNVSAAVLEWERTLELDPTNSDALIQMGTFFATRGDLSKAEEYYFAALRAPRGIADADKSMAYYNLGKILEIQGQPEKALQYYEIFLKLVPIQYEEYKIDAERRVARLHGNAIPYPVR